LVSLPLNRGQELRLKLDAHPLGVPRPLIHVLKYAVIGSVVRVLFDEMFYLLERPLIHKYSLPYAHVALLLPHEVLLTHEVSHTLTDLLQMRFQLIDCILAAFCILVLPRRFSYLSAALLLDESSSVFPELQQLLV
jgi:hypothetical protein